MIITNVSVNRYNEGQETKKKELIIGSNASIIDVHSSFFFFFFFFVGDNAFQRFQNLVVGGLHGFYFIFTYLSCNQQFEANALVPYQLQHIGSRVGCHRIIFENFINLEVRKKENLTTHQKKKKKTGTPNKH